MKKFGDSELSNNESTRSLDDHSLDAASVPATVTFDKPKTRMGGFKKTLVGLCATAGFFGGFAVGAAIPSASDFVPHYLEKAAYYSAAETQIAEAFGELDMERTLEMDPVYMLPADVHPEISGLYYDMQNKKESALEQKQMLQKGGYDALRAVAMTDYSTFWDTTRAHFDKARVADLKGTIAPGMLFGGFGALFLGGLGYAVLKKK